ncbi:MAG: hypothetical protein JXL80_11550, partial [Planctomycetes bacterium]|nr:hypothetical protein [Planctomycetota bacterium]
WREMLLNSPDGVGLQQKLDEQAVDIDLVPDLADAQEPHPGGRDEQPPGQSDTDIGEPSDSSAHGAPSRGKWLFPVVAAAALGAVAFIVLRRRKQSSP